MESLKTRASSALRNAALSKSAKQYLLENPILFSLLLKGAKRYIGGETLEESVMTVKALNACRLRCSLEFIGEDVQSTTEARAVSEEFLRIIAAIKRENVESIISLDLSHIGLTLNKELGVENLKCLAEAAAGSGVEIMISAEGVEQTDLILETFCNISPRYKNVGITLQAYLHRTQGDLQRLLVETQGRIRIVKGAFAASAAHALVRGKELDKRFIKLVEELLVSQRKCSIATHHDELHQKVKALLELHSIPKEDYEFEMLYGIRNDLLQQLKQEGHPCRQYVVYGKEWYLYLCNRIAENPDNLFQLIIDIIE